MEARKTPIYFELPLDLDAQLRQLAQKKERSIAGQLRHLIKEAVEQEGITQNQPVAQAA